MEPKNTVQCDVCKRYIELPPEGSVAISLGPPQEYPEYKDVVRRFGKDRFCVCWVCWLKAFGIKEL